MTPDERDLDALLRQPTERLTPPEGGWEHITRRARRRKWVKASLAVAAGVVVVVGAVPAMIAVRDSNTQGGNSSVQSLSASKTERPAVPVTTVKPAPAPAVSTAPAVPPNLVGFFPDSLSFVSYTHGYAWGSIGSSPAGVIAQTTDGGTTWTKLAAPDVANSFATKSSDADGQIRFSSGLDGFVFGAKYFITTDAGSHWTQAASPGYIDDLEATHNHRVWALVRSTKDSPTVELYTASPGASTLQPVSGVSRMQSAPGADSIAVNHNEVDVIAGGDFWSSNRNGTTWRQGVSPCTANSGPAQSALLTTLNLPGIFAACGYTGSGRRETKATFLSVNKGRSWTLTRSSPAAGGDIQTFAAGDEHHVIAGNSRGGADVTTNGGRTWSVDLPPGGIKLSFVGFINTYDIVGVGRTPDGSAGAFATSYDQGKNWSVTNFGN